MMPFLVQLNNRTGNPQTNHQFHACQFHGIGRLGTVSSATQLFSGFNQHFKPSRSPYLLAGVVSSLALVSVSGLRGAAGIFLLIFIPIGLLFTLLSVLCFYFRARKPMDGEDIADLRKEMDDQFKFCRTVCLSAGVLLLAYLFYRTLGEPLIKLPIPGVSQIELPVDTGAFFWITYVACLIHLGIFACYMTLRNIQEESVANISLFQLTFFTVSILMGVVLSGARIPDQSDLIFSCQTPVQYTEGERGLVPDPSDSTVPRRPLLLLGCDSGALQVKLSAKMATIEESSPVQLGKLEKYLNPEKLLFWYFLLHFVWFEIFWIIRLRGVVRFKFDLVVSE
jgi:hypothetical protein